MTLNTVTIFIILVPIVVLVLLLLSVLFAPVKPDAEKTSSYECGFSAITGQTRSPFTIAYYVVAMLFLVFDLEVRHFLHCADGFQEVMLCLHDLWQVAAVECDLQRLEAMTLPKNSKAVIE